MTRLGWAMLLAAVALLGWAIGFIQGYVEGRRRD